LNFISKDASTAKSFFKKALAVRLSAYCLDIKTDLISVGNKLSLYTVGVLLLASTKEEDYSQCWFGWSM